MLALRDSPKKQLRSRVEIQTSSIHSETISLLCFSLMSRNIVACAYDEQIHHSASLMKNVLLGGGIYVKLKSELVRKCRKLAHYLALSRA